MATHTFATASKSDKARIEHIDRAVRGEPLFGGVRIVAEQLINKGWTQQQIAQAVVDRRRYVDAMFARREG